MGDGNDRVGSAGEAGTGSETGRPAAARPAPAIEIARQLLRLIQTRRLHPGQRLKEQELAARFGVSRARVREALRLLEAKGVVVIEPMRGASVAPMHGEAIFETVEIATTLFALATRRACARITAEELGLLAEGVRELERAAPTAIAPDSFFRMTLRLGAIIATAARAPRLESLIADVRAGWPNILGAIGFTTPALRRRAARNWRALHAALSARDPRRAERLAERIHDEVRAEVERVGW